jgi:tryptophan-rich sensory protein
MTEYLPLQRAWIWAGLGCIIAAALEGVLSGTRVKQRFAELRLPQGAPPLWVWSVLGAAYYVLFFLVLNSLLASPPTHVWTPVALTLAAVALVANATWNWIFFRKKDLWLSYAFFAPYVTVALALALVLYRLRSALFAWYLLYVLYLVYATWWGRSVYYLNRHSRLAA